MAKVVFVPMAAAILLAIGWFSVGTALASDRELRAILDRLACVPERAVSNKLSPTLVIHEVTCKQSGRVVQVECLKTDCRLLAQPRDDDEKDDEK